MQGRLERHRRQGSGVKEGRDETWSWVGGWEGLQDSQLAWPSRQDGE